MTQHNNDWIEGVRRYWYPRIHSVLRTIGNITGLPLYATGGVYSNQYVGVVREAEDVIETELIDAGFERNVVAAFKTLPDGRQSEGSWALRHDVAPDLVEEGMQLHVTLFRPESKNGRAVYAHYEPDWTPRPLDHLREVGFDASTGVSKATTVIDQRTFLILHDRQSK